MFSKKVFWEAFRVFIVLLLTLLFVTLPARLGLAIYEQPFQHNPIHVLLAGLGADMHDVLLCFWPFYCFLHLLFKNKKTFLFLYLAASVVLCMAMIGAIEFKIQRGKLPLFQDLFQADADFVKASWSLLISERYRIGLFLNIVIFFILVALLRRIKSNPLSWPSTLWQGISVIVAATLGFQVYLKSESLFSTITDREEYISPIFAFAESANGLDTVVTQNFLHSSFEKEKLAAGLKIFGFNPSDPERLLRTDCKSHPLTLPLSSSSASSVNPQALILRDSFRKLSKNLFQSRQDKPLFVWHIMLESMRADDVNPLQSKAPTELTPVLNALVRNEKGTGLYSLSAQYMFQGGWRTAEGLMANQCGWSTTPYGIRYTRRLSFWPMRCLTDILWDAGFQPIVNYGSDLAYDNMLHFFKNHHVIIREETNIKDYKNKPRGGWGISDRALFHDVLENVSGQDNQLRHYNFIITLSNHPPYKIPSDLPAEIQQRVQKIVTDMQITTSDEQERSRYLTAAYTDYAVGEFIENLKTKGMLENSLIFIGGDHSMPSLKMWIDITHIEDYATAISQIPFLIIFPQSWLPDANTNETYKKIQTFFSNEVFSENDIPHILLELLSDTQSLKTLPPEKQFHTMPAQRLSPYFEVADYPNAAIIGIDSTAQMFIRRQDAKLLTKPETIIQIHQTNGKIDETNAPFRPAADMMKAFAQHYVKFCPQQN